MLSAYEVGTDTLKSVIKESGLTPESVEDTMDKLSDVLADQKEIEDALHIGSEQVVNISDDDVEEELEKLVALEKASEAAKTEAQLDSLSPVSQLPELEIDQNTIAEDEIAEGLSKMSVEEKRKGREPILESM